MESPERKIDVTLALRVYQKIVDQGSRDGDIYRYRGLRASSDFDGYGVQLSDGTVSLRMFFHSRFTLEPCHGRVVDQFLTRLRRVANS